VELFDKIQESVAYLQQFIKQEISTGVILGTGLGGLSDIVNIELSIPYADIPHFHTSTVQSHAGKLLIGAIAGKKVVMMSGRFHYYEGYDMEAVTFPVRVMKALGVSTLIISNAAGGMNKQFGIGELMLIEDHVNLFPEHPLRGKNDERLGARFPDMSEPYDKQLIALAQDIAKEQGLKVHTGVYIGLQGPTFETPAEYRWLHTIGGDAVGMSTVPEVIVAIHSGIRVFAASIITDIGISDVPVKITLEEVLEAAAHAAPQLAQLVYTLIAQMPEA
jgi:purine-nucleoside phosphorylase